MTRAPLILATPLAVFETALAIRDTYYGGKRRIGQNPKKVCEAVNYRQPPRMPIDMSEAHDDTTLDGCNINMPALSDISLAGSEINVV
ncbi:hypothetical protein AVEN_81846-1 [Araneus ventricosus]|uniref:Uncharacterized protein n=1 Tax=Araneus ventricosus TaxID=182803 RepID=A0A4Y2IEY2_ARAVE|nr:hypothetical protein AVEN_81846-1 [Araneus ventricosus]